MIGGYSGGWNPSLFLKGEDADFPADTFYKTKAGHDYLDFRAWAQTKYPDPSARDIALKAIYRSAKMMKFHPQITKDLKKGYGLVASAALRAMTPAGKWEIKHAMAPFNAVKRDIAKKVSNYKTEQGIVARKGLAGRIDYWNALMDLPENDALVPAFLSGVNNDIARGNPAFNITGPWAEASYPAYKAAIKKRMQDLRDMISKMDPTEYKKYKWRLKAMKQARKKISERRKALREQWKDNKVLKWDKMSYADYVPNVDTYLTDAVNSKQKWADAFSADDLKNYLRPTPGRSMIGDYTSHLTNWGTCTVPVAVARTPYTTTSLSTRVPMLWNLKSIASQQAQQAPPPAQGQLGSQTNPIEVKGDEDDDVTI